MLWKMKYFVCTVGIVIYGALSTFNYYPTKLDFQLLSYEALRRFRSKIVPQEETLTVWYKTNEYHAAMHVVWMPHKYAVDEQP